MEEQYVNGLSDSSENEQDETSERSRQSLPGRSQNAQARVEQKKPAPKLSETDYLLNLWQSDCAELKQAGVKMQLERIEVSGDPAIRLTLLEVNFCSMCETFHGTRAAHICIR